MTEMGVQQFMRVTVSPSENEKSLTLPTGNTAVKKKAHAALCCYEMNVSITRCTLQKMPETRHRKKKYIKHGVYECWWFVTWN
jgi:hypothetical protein